MKNTRILYFLLLLVFYCFPSRVNAQKYRDFSLITHYGVGLEETYASGGSPIVYKGITAKIGLDFYAEWEHLHMECAQQLTGGIDYDLNRENQCFPIGYSGKIAFLYSAYTSENQRFRCWAGGGVGDYFTLLYNTSLANASSAAFNFIDLNIYSKIVYDFSFRKKSTKKPFSIYANVNLPAFSRIKHPGFPYMNTYIMGKNTFLLFDETYESCYHFLSGISTETGISYTLSNHNRITCSYFWEYRSNGENTDCRFDHAQHFLQCAFTFNLFKHEYE